MCRWLFINVLKGRLRGVVLQGGENLCVRIAVTRMSSCSLVDTCHADNKTRTQDDDNAYCQPAEKECNNTREESREKKVLRYI